MNNWYKIFQMASKTEDRDYSWVRVTVPKSIGTKTVKFAKSIPERELYIKKDPKGTAIHGEEWKYGIEDDPHITVLWGIYTKDIRKIRKILEGHRGGKVKLGQIGMFESEDYDVLKVNIISQPLHRLHNALKENIKNADIRPSYNPHLTLAYLKCGNGEKYIKDKRF
jgi:2'-5' RNA ligase